MLGSICLTNDNRFVEMVVAGAGIGSARAFVNTK
jgi:hypothetical protein